MLHARHHFLADVTALLEVDTTQMVHADIVRKAVLGVEIRSHLGNAGRNARLGLSRALGPIFGLGQRDYHPIAQSLAASVTMHYCCLRRFRRPPNGVGFRQHLDFHFGAQAIHLHALEEILGH